MLVNLLKVLLQFKPHLEQVVSNYQVVFCHDALPAKNTLWGQCLLFRPLPTANPWADRCFSVTVTHWLAIGFS